MEKPITSTVAEKLSAIEGAEFFEEGARQTHLGAALPP